MIGIGIGMAQVPPIPDPIPISICNNTGIPFISTRHVHHQPRVSRIWVGGDSSWARRIDNGNGGARIRKPAMPYIDRAEMPDSCGTI